MSISLYAATVPVFRQMLLALSAVLKNGEKHARDRKFDPSTLLQARLCPDMLPLVRQVQIAAISLTASRPALRALKWPTTRTTSRALPNCSSAYPKPLRCSMR